LEIYKKFSFDSAHFLPNLPDEHKCSRMHGHTFYITIYLKGRIDPKTGWIRDFFEIKQLFQPIHDDLDHRILNDINGLENPTSEHLAKWIWGKMIQALPELSKIEVAETCTTGCIYEGE
jgi:6-pyruvoyltetrahydropterin/6-carboxytetrahydropterin synthase|tara:strand:+ start:454 stop:810 length:357 start_codon:yes stop_codon:yes gene_type:complete